MNCGCRLSVAVAAVSVGWKDIVACVCICACLHVCIVGWLAGWLSVWLVGWLAGLLRFGFSTFCVQIEILSVLLFVVVVLSGNEAFFGGNQSQIARPHRSV